MMGGQRIPPVSMLANAIAFVITVAVLLTPIIIVAVMVMASMRTGD